MTNAQRKLSLYKGTYALLPLLPMLLGVSLASTLSGGLAVADETPPPSTPAIATRTLPRAGFYLEQDDEGNSIQGGQHKYIIPSNEIATHYIKGFRTEIYEDETGPHIRLHGFLPRECVNSIQISQIRVNSSPNSYRFTINGIDPPAIQGQPAKGWQQCFNDWYNRNNACPRDGSCVEIGQSSIDGLAALTSLPLVESGPIQMRVESADESGHPTDITVATFTNAADQARVEQREQLSHLCDTARTGTRSDINALREFGIQNNVPNAVNAAASFLSSLEERENAAREAQLTTLIESISEVETLAQGRAKLAALIRAGAQNRSARTRIGEALMTLATKVKDLEVTDGENEVSATMAKFNLVDNVYAAARRFGNRSATAKRNQNALDRYVYTVRTPEVDGTAYAAARRSAESAIRAAAMAARKETGMEHPNRDFAQQGAQFFGWQRDYQGNPVFGMPSASDQIANYARQQAQATRARVDYYNSYQNSGIR